MFKYVRKLITVSLMVAIVFGGAILPKSAEAESATSRITIFSQHNSGGHTDYCKIGLQGNNNMCGQGCLLYSFTHMIQWCSGQKMNNAEGYEIMATLAQACPNPWDNGYTNLKCVEIASGYDILKKSDKWVPKTDDELIEFFDNGGALMLLQPHWGRKSGHWITAVGYTYYDVTGDGEKEFLLQIVDSAVWSSYSRIVSFKKYKMYDFNTYKPLTSTPNGGGQYWIEKKVYKAIYDNGYYYVGAFYPRIQMTEINGTDCIAISTKSSLASDTCRLQKYPYDEDRYNTGVLEKDTVIYITSEVRNKYDNIWYKVEDASGEALGYVYSGDVKIVEPNITNKSETAYSAVGISKNTNCYLKDKAYEATAHSATVAKGESVDIVAKVVNYHGNTWYKTADGKYVYSGDVTTFESTPLFFIHAGFKNLEKRASHVAPYQDSAEVKTIKKDATVISIKFVVNSHGNIWAQLEDDSYLCFYDAKTKEQKLSFVAAVSAPSVASVTKPTGNLTKGKTFAINGIVSTKVPLLTVSSHIINRETNAEASGGGTPVIAYPSYSSQKVNINSSVNGVNINLKTMFSKLSAGWYRYELRTQYGFTYNDTTFRFGDSQTLVSSDFSVNKAGETFDEDVTTTPTEYSTLFTLDAKFTYNESATSHQLPYADSAKVNAISNGQLVTVKQFVTNQYGNIWAQLSDNSFVCFHDMAKDETYMTFNAHVTQPTHSTTYPTGNIKVTASEGFWLKGPVEAKVPFLTVSTRIIDRTTGDDVAVVGSPVSVSPAATVRKLELWVKNDSTCLDSRTLFRKLAGTSGWYTYQLNVQFGFKHEGKTFKFGNEMNLVTSDFTVNNPKGEEPPAGDVPETVPVTLVNITNTMPVLLYGESHEFQCQVFPSNATKKTVTWSSSDETVLKLLPDENGGATVCYVGCGSTTITARANDGSGTSHSVEIKVAPRLNCTWGVDSEVLVGRSSSGILWLTTEPANAPFEILSGDTRIVTVKKQEMDPGQYEIEMVGVAPGTSFIAVQAYQNACRMDITVRQPVYVKSIDIYGLPSEMKVGETADLYYVFNPENNDCTGWGVFSSDPSVVEVLYGDADWDETGNYVEPVIARAPGKVTIRVEAHDGSGVFATHTITVKGSVLSGDANEDGLVNIYDVLLVLQYSSGWDVTLTTENADVDKDGVVGLSDAVQILRYCTGGDLVSALRALKELLGGLDISTLEILKQPVDQYVSIDQKAQFAVTIAGEEVAYQWYINRNDGNSWCKLNGAVGSTYVTSAVEADCDGFQYRCVITDVYGSELTSDVAVLHVVLELPVTGDASMPALWLALCMLSALGMVIVNKQRALR